MTRVPCRACQKRRKILEAKLLAKQAKGKKVQAAAIGAVLTTTALVGRLIGEEDGQNDLEEREHNGVGDPDGIRADHRITEPLSTGSREDR